MDEVGRKTLEDARKFIKGSGHSGCTCSRCQRVENLVKRLNILIENLEEKR